MTLDTSGTLADVPEIAKKPGLLLSRSLANGHAIGFVPVGVSGPLVVYPRRVTGVMQDASVYCVKYCQTGDELPLDESLKEDTQMPFMYVAPPDIGSEMHAREVPIGTVRTLEAEPAQVRDEE